MSLRPCNRAIPSINASVPCATAYQDVMPLSPNRCSHLRLSSGRSTARSRRSAASFLFRHASNRINIALRAFLRQQEPTEAPTRAGGLRDLFDDYAETRHVVNHWRHSDDTGHGQVTGFIDVSRRRKRSLGGLLTGVGEQSLDELVFE
jgi:hypothetical protein